MKKVGLRKTDPNHSRIAKTTRFIEIGQNYKSDWAICPPPFLQFSELGSSSSEPLPNITGHSGLKNCFGLCCLANEICISPSRLSSLLSSLHHSFHYCQVLGFCCLFSSSQYIYQHKNWMVGKCWKHSNTPLLEKKKYQKWKWLVVEMWSIRPNVLAY